MNISIPVACGCKIKILFQFSFCIRSGLLVLGKREELVMKEFQFNAFMDFWFFQKAFAFTVGRLTQKQSKLNNGDFVEKSQKICSSLQRI